MKDIEFQSLRYHTDVCFTFLNILFLNVRVTTFLRFDKWNQQWYASDSAFSLTISNVTAMCLY